MRKFARFALLSLVPALAACGGAGDGGMASIPSPIPSVTPATNAVTRSRFDSPATRAGTYDTIALITQGGAIPGPSTDRLAAPGELKVAAYQSTSQADEVGYTLVFSSPGLPTGQSALAAVFPARDVETKLGNYSLKFGELVSITASDGDRAEGSRIVDDSTATRTTIDAHRDLLSQLDAHVGLSYVSLGQWNWWVSDASNGNTTEYNSAYFAYGDRTPPGSIPPSGTATFTGKSLGFSTDSADRGSAYGAPIDVTLTADFGQQSMSALLQREYSTGGDYVGGFTSVAAVDLRGTGSIVPTGSFAIPLSGTVGVAAATGALDGAFFGPSAQQVGGVFSAGSGGQPLVHDAFVASKVP